MDTLAESSGSRSESKSRATDERAVPSGVRSSFNFFPNLRAGDPEVEQEWAVATTLAGIKLALGTANFAVILLDKSVPAKGDDASLNIALLAALAFWIYLGASYLSLRRRWVDVRQYAWFSPLCDISLAGVLILATDGYASPFNTWLGLAVVATGFSPDRRIPLLATIGAIAAHMGIALVPQSIPFDAALLMVRTTYLFGFAAMVAALGGTLSRQARALGVVERTGAALGGADTEKSANDLLFSGLRRLLDDPSVELTPEDGARVSHVGKREGSATFRTELGAGSSGTGTLRISRNRPFDDTEIRWINLLCERYTAALRRIKLTADLLDASAKAERMRMADELHDGHIQTLTALGFHLEALRLESGSNEELTNLCGMVRRATIQARRAIDPLDVPIMGGEEHIRGIFAERWAGDYSIDFDPNANLSEGQWGLLEAAVKEGLNNAQRHGRSSVVRLQVRSLGTHVLAVLDSDGASPAPEFVPGYGMKRLGMLASKNDATIHLGSGKYGGATLTITFNSEEGV